MSLSRSVVVALVLSSTSAAYAQSSVPKISAKAKAAAEAEAYTQVKAEAYATAKIKADAEAKTTAEAAAIAKAEADVTAVIKAKADEAAKADENLMERGRQLMADSMRDPDSTKFRDVYLSANRNVVCGLYNSKNGNGGYSGYAYFFVNLKYNNVSTEELYVSRYLKDYEFYEAFERLCK